MAFADRTQSKLKFGRLDCDVLIIGGVAITGSGSAPELTGYTCRSQAPIKAARIDCDTLFVGGRQVMGTGANAPSVTGYSGRSSGKATYARVEADAVYCGGLLVRPNGGGGGGGSLDGYATIAALALIEALPSNAFPACVTSTGDFIGGEARSGDNVPVYWDAARLIHALSMPDTETAGQVYGIADGATLMAGVVSGGSLLSGSSVPVYWDAAFVVHVLPMLDSSLSGVVFGLARAGNLMVGINSIAVTGQCAVYWDAMFAVHQLPVPAGSLSGDVAYCVSADLSVIGGSYQDPSNFTKPCYWDGSFAFHALAPPNDFDNGQGLVYAVNHDGTKMAGYGFLTSQQHAVYWDAAKTPHDLGLLPGGTYSYATGVSDAGIIVGSADDGTNEWSVYWDTDLVIHQLARLPGSTDTYPGEANAISGDGSTIVSDGDDSNGNPVAIIYT